MLMLSWVNHVDGASAVLSASQAAGDLAIQNIANPIVGKHWRTTSLTAWGQVDFGADKTVGVLALVFPRHTTGTPLSGTIHHQLDADGGTAGSGAAYDSTAISIGTAEGYGYHLHKLTSPITARYWRFTFNVSGVDFIDVGRAWAGEAWEPAVNYSLGHGEAWNDLSRISASARSGAEFVDERPRQRAFAFGLEFMDGDDRDDIREMQRLVGLSKQVLVCRNTASPAKETLVGRLSDIQPITEPGLDIFSKAFRLRESL